MSAGRRSSAASDSFQPKSHDTLTPRRRSVVTSRVQARQVAGTERQVHVGGRGRGERGQQTRLELGVHAVEGDEGAVGGGGERGRDGMRLARPAQVGHAHPFTPEADHGGVAERAHDRGRQPEPGRADGRDDGAAADGGVEGVRLDLFPGARQAIEAEEDQILEGFAGREQSRSGHAGLYPERAPCPAHHPIRIGTPGPGIIRTPCPTSP